MIKPLPRDMPGRTTASSLSQAWARSMLAQATLAFSTLFAVVLLICGAPASAHDIPGEMRVHAFAKAEGERLQVLVRLPLALLLNIDLPKKGPGYIDLAQVEAGIARAIAATDKGIDVYEDGRQLSPVSGTGRISLPSDQSFEDFESAKTSLLGPKLPDDAYVFWNQGYFDAYLEYPIDSAQSSFTIDFNVSPGLGDRLKLDLRYIGPDGVVRAYDLSAGAGAIALDPHWYQAAWSFTKSGFEHILDGPDHLLFLLCLILPFRRLDWNLAGVITAFTVGHSITLIAAAYQVMPSGAWFPPLVELFIAASILYMAIENLVKPDLNRRWLISGLFGLVHGFGFSFMLQAQLQFAGSHLLLSLLAFNVGIELGQLLVLLVAIPLLNALYRSRVAAEGTITAIICLLIGHTTWHWMGERFEALKQAEWALNIQTVTALLLMSVAAACIGGLAWLIAARYQSRKRVKMLAEPPGQVH
jgi:hypothetical protein